MRFLFAPERTEGANLRERLLSPIIEMRPVSATVLAMLVTCSLAAQQPKRVRIAPELAAQYTRKVIPPPTTTAGNATLKIVVSPEGNVIDVSPISGDSAVVRVASKAVRQWTYSPYFLNGEPVEFETEVTIRVSRFVRTRQCAENDEPVSSPLIGWAGYTNSGKSVAGMTIQVFTAPGTPVIASATTDSDGRFSLPQIVNGKYYLKGLKKLEGRLVVTADAVVTVKRRGRGVACLVADAEELADKER